MTYIDAYWDRDKNYIDVVERHQGRRLFNSFPCRYTVYFPSPKGKYQSIFGERLDVFKTHKWEAFQRELRTIDKDKQYESDINPIFRCLYDNYRNTPIPNLNVAYFDIEVALDPVRGYSSTEEAFCPVNAISVYCSWMESCITLVLKPPALTVEEAEQICGQFENTVLCHTENLLLDAFLNIIDDADIITGWNSTGYDIPYMVNRISQILGKEHTKRFCLWNKFPRKREFESYGRLTTTYDIYGRVHMDYLDLYRKHTYHEMHSYRLDFVGEYEVGEKKVAYEGNLDMLWNQDFEKFVAYNRQDVMLLVKIDQKLKFIELSNTLAHENLVLLPTTLGSVQLIDNAITNSAHDLNLVVPNKKRSEDYGKTDPEEESHGIPGAYVADPEQGMHDWIGAMDINSLYPSAIRSLNMSKETVVGQIRLDQTNKLIERRMKQEKKSFADAWSDLFGTLEYNQVINREHALLTIDFEDGTSVDMTGDEIYQWVFLNPKRKLILSANGTIFDGDKIGLIPKILEKWYAERKSLQATAKSWNDLLNVGIEIPEELLNDIKQMLE